MTDLATALRGVRRLAVDSAPFIYLIERHPEFGPCVRAVRAERGELELVTSSITIAEVLSKPFQRGEDAIAEAYKSILLNSPYLRLLPVGADTAEQAARLRAAYHLRTPDAVQLAVAVQERCGAFLTNDSGHKRIEAPKVLVVSELEL